MRNAENKFGFTLIEMAVVLIILGIIATLVLPIVSEKLKQDKLAKSRGTLNALKQEIIGYAGINQKLPAETTVETSFANARDAQQNYIAYYVDPVLKTSDICSVTSTNYSLTIGSSTYSNLAFLIASRGANQNLQINAGAIDATTRTITSYTQGTATDTANPNPVSGLSQTYDLSGTGQPDTTLQFDDLVDYVTLSTLQTKIGCKPAEKTTGAAVGFDKMASDWTKDAQNFRSSSTTSVQVSSSSMDFGNGVTNAYACIWSNATVPDANLNGIWDGFYQADGVTPLDSTTHGVNKDGDHEHLVCRTNGDATTPVVYCYGVTSSGGFTQWKRIAAVFKFSTLYADKNVNSGDYTGGLVFGLITANANGNTSPAQNATAADNSGAASPCGDDTAASGNRGAYLGWSDSSGGGNCIRTPKIGVEIDLSYDSSRNDPDVSTLGAPCSLAASTFANHVAVVYYTASGAGSTSSSANDNQHGNAAGTSGIVNPPYAAENSGGQGDNTKCSQDAANRDGFATNATAWYDQNPDRQKQWLEDQESHWIRIQVERNTTTHVYDVYVWLDDTPNVNFLNVNLESGAQMTKGSLSGADYYEHDTVTLTAADDTKFDYFRFGWTFGAGSTGAQTINLSDFGLNASRNN